MANHFSFYVFCFLACGQLLGKKQHRTSLKLLRLFFLLTTTTQATAQATGGSGVRSSHGRGGGGPHHHHQQDFMIFSLWQELPLLVNVELNLINRVIYEL